MVVHLTPFGKLVVYEVTKDGNWYHFDNNFWIRSDVVKTIELEDKVLDVPYISQSGEGADFSFNDCGPACSLMLAKYKEPNSLSVNDFMRLSGINHKRTTTFYENMVGLKNLGLKPVFKRPFLTTEILEHLPCMVLISYRHLRPTEKYAHFVVVVGYEVVDNKLFFIIHDPYQGPNIKVSETDFKKAFTETSIDGNLPQQGVYIGG